LRDSFDRRIRYLRVSVTDRCNLRCAYCVPPMEPPAGTAGSGAARRLREGEPISFGDIERIARAAVGLGVDKLRLTGGEPLVRRGIAELVARLARIEGLATLCMTTNGTLLAPLAAELRRAGLVSLNLSLDTLDPARYERMTGGGCLADAIAGLDAALAAGIQVKLNIVVPRVGDTADAEAVERYARERGAASQRILRYDLAADKLDDPRFDRPPPCARCDRIRLLADGRLKPCLHSDIAIPVDMDDIEGSLLACVGMKPERGGACTTLAVGQIGG
jgi:cyclic pyranopterin phosphate synthase